jgi:hypothetical protein
VQAFFFLERTWVPALGTGQHGSSSIARVLAGGGPTSPGRKALPEMALSTAGISSCRFTGSFNAMTMVARPSALAAPPMSFFIQRMPSAGLRSRPPESKHTPLPTSVSRGWRGLPQFSSIKRGARLEARPTACTAGKPLFSKASPTTSRNFAPCARATALTAADNSAGPMCSAGVLTRSRVAAMAVAITSPREAASEGAICSSAAARLGAL